MNTFNDYILNFTPPLCFYSSCFSLGLSCKLGIFGSIKVFYFFESHRILEKLRQHIKLRVFLTKILVPAFLDNLENLAWKGGLPLEMAGAFQFIMVPVISASRSDTETPSAYHLLLHLQ